MKKIPLTPIEESSPPASQAPFLANALETLLLGGIWLFVLVILPVLQHVKLEQADALLMELAKAVGIVSAVLPLWVAGLRWKSTEPQETALNGKAFGLLLAIAIGGVIQTCLAVGGVSLAVNLPYVLALQGILALAYFIARHLFAKSN